MYAMRCACLIFFVLSVYVRITRGEAAPVGQVHISLAGTDDEGNSLGLAISWQTVIDTVTSTVKYGTTSGSYDFATSGSSSSYYETFHHHVVLPKLEADTTYYYIAGDEEGGFSKEFEATTAPSTENLRGNFSFAVFADLGIHNGEASTAFVNKWVENDDVRLVWHGGDISYADDSFLHKECVAKFCFEEVWDNYMQSIEPWASKVPYMVTPGNHEADCHSPNCLTSKTKKDKLSNFTAYNTRFRMPASESKSEALNMHYSFNYGNVHFISLDTETGYPGAAEETRYVLPCGGFADQLSWLENDLIEANKNRATRPWILAQGHHPMYQGNSINKEFQTAMEKLFYDYGVDVYFSGHVHSYERDAPVYQGVVDENSYVNPSATTYFMIGGSGNDEMRGSEVSDPSPLEGLGGLWKRSPQNGPWTMVTDEDHFGIGKVNIWDDNQLEVQYFRTTSGELFDSIVLTRDHSPYIEKYTKNSKGNRLRKNNE